MKISSLITFLLVFCPQFLIAQNTRIKSFSKAKKLLISEVYPGVETTFYCGCSYTGKILDQGCHYIPKNRSDARSHSIEWEHIVPAADFGRSFAAWRHGHRSCISKSGKKYKGRKCARKVSRLFRSMESDLYNLVPAIGELNNLRGHKPPAKITQGFTSKSLMVLPGSSCKTYISSDSFEPRNEVKGFVARVYKYMHYAYPKQGIISRKNEKLFDAWDKMYPPSEQERLRAEKISKIQGNKNIFVTNQAHAGKSYLMTH